MSDVIMMFRILTGAKDRFDFEFNNPRGKNKRKADIALLDAGEMVRELRKKGIDYDSYFKWLNENGKYPLTFNDPFLLRVRQMWRI